jgi:hypothetical protein
MPPPALVEEMVARHAGGGTAIVASHQPFTLPALLRLDLAEHRP